MIPMGREIALGGGNVHCITQQQCVNEQHSRPPLQCTLLPSFCHCMSDAVVSCAGQHWAELSWAGQTAAAT